jgi:hypothetical protein
MVLLIKHICGRDFVCFQRCELNVNAWSSNLNANHVASELLVVLYTISSFSFIQLCSFVITLPDKFD